MRRKLIVILIVLVIIPIVILYFISEQLFEKSMQDNLKILNNKISSMLRGSRQFFENSIEVSMYPINESNLHGFLTATGMSQTTSRR